MPSRVDEPGFPRALLARRLLGQHVGQQPIVLMSTRPQRLSGTVITAMPFSAQRFVARRVERARRDHDARRVPAGGKA